MEAAGEAAAALTHLLLSMELPRWMQEPTGLAALAALAAQRLGSARQDSACSSSARWCLGPGSAPRQAPLLSAWCRCAAGPGAPLHAAEPLSPSRLREAVEGAGEAVAALIPLVPLMGIFHRKLEPTGLVAQAALAALRLGSARLGSVPQKVPRPSGWCRCVGVSLHVAERLSWLRSASQLVVGRQLPLG